MFVIKKLITLLCFINTYTFANLSGGNTGELLKRIDNIVHIVQTTNSDELIPEVALIDDEPEDYLAPPTIFISTSNNETDSDSRLRNFNTIAADSDHALYSIQSYGCWCHFPAFEIGVTVGGQPQDHLDQKCKELYHSYWCAGDQLNSEEIPNKCHVELVEYNSGMTYTYTIGGIVNKILYKSTGNEKYNSKYKKAFKKTMKSCQKYGRTECEKRACQIEMKFLFDIVPEVYMSASLSEPNGVDESLDRRTGFAAGSTCKIDWDDDNSENNRDNDRLPIDGQDPSTGGNGGNTNHEDDDKDIVDPLEFNVDKPIAHQILVPVHLTCCGEVPYQFMYNGMDANVECCNKANALFNPVIECCIDDSISETCA